MQLNSHKFFNLLGLQYVVIHLVYLNNCVHMTHFLLELAAPVAQSVSARYLYDSIEPCRGCEFEPHLGQLSFVTKR